MYLFHGVEEKKVGGEREGAWLAWRRRRAEDKVEGRTTRGR
jgi:hypothetical protein